MEDTQTPASQTETAEPTQENEANTSEETSQEGTEELAAAPAAKTAAKEEKKRNLKKLKLNIYGKEVEEEIDLDNDDYLRTELQKAKAFQKKSQDYSDLEKSARTFIDNLRRDPKAVLSDPKMGVDLKALAKLILEEEIANSQKSPEQLAKEKLEAELKTLKDEREKEKEDFRQRELSRLQEQQMERYDILMDKALSENNIPPNPYFVKRMADYMILGLDENMDITPQDVLPLVMEEMKNDLRDMFTSAPEDVVEEWIGKEVLTRIRKKQVAKAKDAMNLKGKIPDVGAKKDKNEKKGDPKKTYRDFFGV